MVEYAQELMRAVGGEHRTEDRSRVAGSARICTVLGALGAWTMMLSMAFSDVKKFFLRWRKELVGLAVLVGLASAVLLLLWQLGQITLVGQVTVVQIITGLLVLLGLYWTSRRVKATEDNVRVAEEGHITERFTRAIAQLGDDKMAIRLGGIYALERIAKDSEKDRGPVMEVLTAYVREKAPRQEEDTPKESQPPPTDIQAILTVIGRRETTGNNRGNGRLDLTHTQLVRADLRGASLCGADLSEANLREAKLYGTDLRGADLYKTSLRGAALLKADLREADLSEASLRETRLYGADLRGANLSGASLNGADLSGANLCGVVLRRADLYGANLREADNLTAEQIRPAENWLDAHLPASLRPLLTKPPA